MKVFRKLTSVVLTMCLLLGLPMAISAAESIEESEDLRLIGAQPISSAMNPGADTVLLMNFDRAITWDNSVTVRIVAVDDKNNVVSYWKVSNGSGASYGGGIFNGYTVSLSETTWTKIIDAMANDAQLSGKGYRLQVRIYEKGEFTSGNGTVDSVYDAATKKIRLTADHTDNNTAASVGITAAPTVRDYACMDIGTVEVGATEITPTGVVTLDSVQMIDETSMWLNFSEAVTIDAERTDAVMQVLGAATGASQMDATVSLLFSSGNRIKAKLTDSTWSAIKAKWQENTTRKISFRLTEKDLNGEQGEYAFSYTVDTVRGAVSDKPLKSDRYTANGDGRMDYVTVAVEGPQLRLVGAQPIMQSFAVTDWGAEWNDKGLLLNFNEKLAAFNDSSAATIRVALVDENNNVVTNSSDGKAMYWKTAGAGFAVHGVNGYVVRLASAEFSYDKEVVTWPAIADMLANDTNLTGKGYRLQVRVYERSTYQANNDTVDSIKSATDSTVCLTADATDSSGVLVTNTREYACADIGMVMTDAQTLTPTGVITLDGVQMIDETSMWLNFSDAVTVDVARTEAKIEVVGTLGGIFMDTPVTLTEGNAKAVKATLTDVTWTQIQATWSENQTRTIRLTLTEKNIDAAKAEFANSYTVDTVQGAENEMVLQSNLYAADTENAERMDFVTATVDGPQAWKLTGNETVSALIIPAGVTLDLNGHRLTVTTLNSYGDLIDTTEGAGGLCLSGDNPFLSLYQNNAALPLYDAGEDCYRFFTPEFEVKPMQQIDGDTVKYAIRLGLPSADAYTLLAAEENCKNIFMKLELLNQDDTQKDMIHYIFSKDIIEEYATKSSVLTTKYGITLTVSGIEDVTQAGLQLRTTACVNSYGVQRSSVY